MSARKQFNLVLYGQKVSGLKLAIGESADFNFTCEDPNTRDPINLTGGGVQMSICALGVSATPIAPPVISHQATIVSAPAGTGTAPINSGDTVPAGIPLYAGTYGIDFFLTDALGNRLGIMAYGEIELTPVATLPGTPITPLPQQALLAGSFLSSVSAVKIADYAAKLSELVRGDPTAGGFAVTLPAASAGAGVIAVVNQSNSNNPVTVTPAGLDTIDGAGAVPLLARETVLLYSDGVSDWILL